MNRAVSRAQLALVALGAALAATACTNDGPTVSSADDLTSQGVTSIAPTPVTAVVTTTTTVPATTTSTSTTTTTTSTTTSTTTTTTVPLVTAGAVVKVANAADVPRAAAALTTQLSGLGFTLTDPVNAAAWDERLDVTKVYSRDESRPVAESVARALGGVAVERLPTPAPIVGATAALGDATVLVMLGADLAGKPLPPTAPPSTLP